MRMLVDADDPSMRMIVDADDPLMRPAEDDRQCGRPVDAAGRRRSSMRTTVDADDCRVIVDQSGVSPIN